MTHPVAPELFELLERYASAIQDGHVAIDDNVTAGSRIVAFLNGFFEQFFDNVLGTQIHGPNEADSEAAERLRSARQLPEEQEALVMMFEDYCEWAPDIYGSDYGGYDYIFEEFHREFLQYLVEDIVAWTETTGDDDLVDAAERARTAYVAAV